MTETITFSEPIQIDGRETYNLTMREPSVADILAMKKTAQSLEEQEMNLFSNLCEITPDNMRSLKWKDYRKLQRVFAQFIGEENPLE